MALFDNIASVYVLFFYYQTKYFTKIINKAKEKCDITHYKNVLDIGCGTGAMLKVLYEKGLDVKGIDTSRGMLQQAKRKLKNLPIELIHTKAGTKLPFNDKSFDVVYTSYVAHGLVAEQRINLYAEMKRLAKEIVIVHDYNENREFVTNLIEWFERGDYFNFIKVAENEMNSVFSNVTKINVGPRDAWYICK